jgi:hypothetical protein
VTLRGFSDLLFIKIATEEASGLDFPTNKPEKHLRMWMADLKTTEIAE